MADPLALPRVRGNVEKMIGAGAPAHDIDDYLASEGYTPDTFKAAVKPQSTVGQGGDPILVHSTDGQRFQFPAGTDELTMKRALKEYYRSTAVGRGGGPAGPPDPPPERSLVRKAGDFMRDQAGWQATGAINAAGGAADFGDMISPAAPIRNALGMVAPEFTNFLSSGRLTRQLAHKAGGVPVVNTPEEYGGKYTDAVRDAVIGAAVFPGSVVRNVMPAAVGGVTSELAGQQAAGTPYEPLARAGGGVVGGVVGATGQTVIGGLKNAIVETFRPATQAGARTTAAKVFLDDLATDPKAARAALDTAPAEVVKGSRPTTAKLTNDPGLLATENVLAGSAGRGGEFSLRSADNALARSTATEAIQPGGSVAAVSDFFRKQIEASKGNLSAADQAAAARVQAALDALPAGATPQQTGDAIRTALQQRVDILKTVRSDASKPLYDAARASDANVPPTDAISTLNKAGATAVGGKAGAVEAATKYLTRPDGTPKSSIAELDDAFKQLGDDIAAARAAGQNSQVALLTQVKGQVEKAMQGEPLYDAAKGTFEGLSRPLDKFNGPGVTNVLARDPKAGTYNMPPDTVAQQFLRQGPQGAASMREFVGTAGPNAVESMKGYISEQVRALPPMQVEGYLRRHSAALDALDPKFSAQLRTIVTEQQNATNVARTGSDAGKAIDRSAPSQFLTSDPENAISRTLGRPDARARMTALVTEANKDTTGASIEGLRRGIVQDFVEATRTTATDARGNQGVSPAAVSRWWDSNKDAIRPALTRQQYEDLERVVADAARDARSAPKMAGSDTARNLDTGRLIQTRIAAAIVGQRAANSPIMQSLMRPVGFLSRIPEERVRNALTDIALDPDLARRSLPTVNAIEQSMIRARMNAPGNAFRAGAGAPIGGMNQRER